MHVEFSPEATLEYEEGERYYERQLPGLGARFHKEVRDALQRLRTWPLSAPIECGDIRRVILSRFPYKLLYSVERETIYIVAVAHMHRAPDYWVERRE